MVDGRWWLAAMAAGLLSVLGGCGDNDPQAKRAISGTVTLDGAPVANGSLSFQPEQPGGTASGAVITNGKYAVPREHGLPVGKYKVLIFAPKPGTGQLPPGGMPGDPIPPAEELIPPEYNVNSSQFIEVQVKGPYQFDFKILGKKG